MKAIVFTRYGPPDVLQLKDVQKPTPKDSEVLIRTYAATVIAGDCELRSFKFPIWFWLPLRIEGKLFADVVWSYADPLAECGRIKDHLCFFNERVESISVDGEIQPKPRTRWSPETGSRPNSDGRCPRYP